MSTASTKTGARVQLFRFIGGAAFGGIAALLFFELVAEGRMALDDPAVMLAMTTGLIYALLGLIVAFGSAAPNAGAHFLNVENAEEIREERPKLRTASVAYILIGIMLMVLAAAGEGPESLIATGPALVVAGACFLGAVVSIYVANRQADELLRQVGLEASSLALSLALVLLGGWAALAHLGYVDWLAPLAYLAIVAILELLAIFWAAGRKGLLQHRPSES